MTHIHEGQALSSEVEAFFQNSPDLMLIRTLDGSLLCTNPAIEKALGWTQDEAWRMEASAFIHPEDLDVRDRAFESIRFVGGSTTWECRCLSKDGTYKWIRWSCTGDLGNNRAYLVGRDITEARGLLERLESSQRNLANAQALAGIGSWSYDIATNRFTVTDEYYRIVGYEPGAFEPTWSNCLRCVHPDDRDLVEEADLVEKGGGQSVDTEVRILRPNGDIRFVRSRIYPTLGADGKPVRFDGTIEDITDRKRSEAEMSHLLSHARCLLWQAKVWMEGDECVWDTQIRNPEAAEQFLPIEIPPGEDYSAAFYAAKLSEDADRMRLTGDLALRDGSAGYQQEFRIRLANGQVRWIFEDVSITQLATDQWLLSGVCTDVTEQKKSQEEMSRVLTTARCLLFQADVHERDGNFVWTTHIRNLDGAQQFLPVHIPDGLDYVEAFHRAKVREDAVRMRQRSDQALRNGEGGYRQEFRVRRLDGEVRWLAEDVHVDLVGEGHWHATGVCTDITERKLAEETMSQLLTGANCLLWQAQVVDRGGLLHWEMELHDEETARRFLPIDVPSGFTYLDAFETQWHPDDVDRMHKVSEEAIRSGANGYQHEYRVKAATGEIRWLSENVSIKSQGNGQWRLTGVCTDISESKKNRGEILQVLESARCLLWQAHLYDRDGVLDWHTEFSNTEAAQAFMPLEIPQGWSYTKAFDAARLPEDAPTMRLHTAAEIPEGKSGYQQEFRIKTASGDIRWLSEDVTINRVEPGHWLLTGVCTDVTERKKAQEETSHVLSSAHCLLWQAEVTDVGGSLEWNLRFRNPEAAQQFLPVEIPPGGSYTDGFFLARPREHSEAINNLSTTALRSGQKGYQQEFSVRSVNGNLHWLSEDVQINPQGPGRWLLTGVCTDITERKNMETAMLHAQEELQSRVHDRTRDLRHANIALQEEIAERKQAQEELKESEMRYRAIVEDQTEMICRFLADGTFTFVNDAHCRYFEALPEDLLGRSFIDFLSPEDATRVKAHLESLGPDNPVGTYEISSLSRDGEIRWQRWTDRCIWNEEGEFVCFQSVGHDITARKKSQEALLLAKEEAERANLAKSEFLSRMSHELRTPLNAILGFGQLLDRNELDAVQKESVQHILKGGRHLLDLVNEVLDLARVEAGRTDVSIEPVSIADVIRESLGLVTSLGSEHGVTLAVDVAKFARYYVLADQQRLKQVLINLLSNGIKYNRAGGSVEIHCSIQHDRLQIDVRDTGRGIAPDDLGKLFTPFERLGANNSEVEGTGLGLALSKRLISLMNGSLEVESKVGEGSTFSILLPIAESPEQKILAIATDLLEQGAALPPARTYTLLCIEDNLSNLRLVEVLLGSRPGIELLSARQGSVGLDLARRLQPDLILLDLNLPDISGMEVLVQLRQSEHTQDIPVIVVSADATPLRIERLLSIGADAYLTKPLDVTEFLATLDRFLK